MLIATAGHVDHGKTTLVRALTGVETDRLPEEKRRGLTIEPGFAYLTTAEGITLGFVDVPGHKKFIRQMVAVVGSVDIALLVVAADDGVMPQTREHVAILELLGVARCVVAITRCDLVGTDRLSQVHAEVADFLGGSALNAVASVSVCAPRGRGVDQLLGELLAADQIERTAENHYFRMAVDRVFTIHGIGTVVTGAVVSGIVREGDIVNLLPAQRSARVRSIHANDKASMCAQCGQRAALNLPDVDTDSAARGSWITSSGQQLTSRVVDARLRVLLSEDKALKHWTPVHVHVGSADVGARVSLYDMRAIEPGEQACVQLVFDAPIHVVFGDRYVLRDQTASRTIGGGHVIDPRGSRERHFRRGRLAVLQALDAARDAEALVGALAVSPDGLHAENWRLGRNLPVDVFTSLIQAQGIGVYTDAVANERLFEIALIDKVQQQIVQSISDYHLEHPSATGIDSRLLQANCHVNMPVFNQALELLVRQRSVERVGFRCRMSDFRVQLDSHDQALLEKLHSLLHAEQTRPPPLALLSEHIGVSSDELLQQVSPLLSAGCLIKVATNRLYHPLALSKLIDLVHQLALDCGSAGFAVGQFRDRSGIGRNLTVDVLEYFDRAGLTRHTQDRRRILRHQGRNQGQPLE